jgi:hypothetical protein
MATIGKKRKKPGATKKRKTVATTPKKTISIKGANGNSTYKHDACFGKKTDAQKRADRIRAQGNKARVIESGSAHCVYKGGKMKANAPAMRNRRRRAA